MRPTTCSLRHQLIALISPLALALPFSAQAAFTGTTNWQGAASGIFGTGSNWSTNWTASGSNYLLRINSGGTPVVIAANATIGGLDIASGFQLIRNTAGGNVILTISGSLASDTFFNNSGTITSANGLLRLAVSSNANTLANSGIMEATAGNTLSIQSTGGGSLTLNNTGGTLRTVGTGDLSLASNQNGSVSLSGGSVQNTAGTIDQKNLTNYSNVALTNGGFYTLSTNANASVAQGVTLSGTTTFANSGTVSLVKNIDGTSTSAATMLLNIASGSAALSNGGVITIASSGTGANSANAGLAFGVSSTVSNSGLITISSQSTTGNTQIDVGGNTATFAGTGTLALKVDVGGAVGKVLVTGTSSGAGQLVNGAGHTISGAGQLGNDMIGTITNNGTINADDATSALTINPFSTTGSVVNSGTLRASGAAGLVLADGNYSNSGRIQVDAGSVLTTNAGAAITNSGAIVISGSWNGGGSIANNSTISYSSTVNSSVSTTISGTGSLSKSSSGTLTLTGNNTYTGTTNITAGTLVVNGSGASAVVVGSAATLSGTGSIGNSVTVNDGGILAPGNSPGALNTGALTLSGSASTLAMELSGTGAGTYDQVNVTGTVNLNSNGQLQLSLLSGFNPNQGDIFFLIINDGADAINGTLFGLANLSTFSAAGKVWQVSYFGNAESPTPSFTGGNDLALQVVPEPAATLLVGFGLFSMLTLWRRRRS